MKRWHYVVLATAILMVVIVLGFGLNGVNKFELIFTNQKALENVNNILQIIAAVAVILGAFIGVWQYVLSAECERTKIENEKVEKAIQLSEYYKDNILYRIAIVKTVFKMIGVKNVLEKIRPSDMINFDCEELREHLSKADLKELNRKMDTEEIADIVCNVLELISDFKGQRSWVDVNGIKNAPDKTEYARRFMSGMVNDLLNDMEYFAMYFTHGVADESVVFQSLHQTYVESVQLLYYNIAKNNEPNGKQFYTNVVELYRLWFSKQQSIRNKSIEDGRNINKGNVAGSIK